jgi:cyclomaltodextrinase / maltogenic alpha-amylase / neopullulanase
MMNLLASHDAPRVSTSLYNKNQYKFNDKPYDDENYKIDMPDAQTRAIQEMLLIFQYTYIGAPHIWNGDEVGMWGADDPDTRKPMVWKDIQYEDETHHPFDKIRKRDKVQPDTTLLNYYKALIKIRKANPALIYGDITFSLIDDANRTLAYSRTYESKEIVVAFNKSEKKQILKIPVKKNGNYKNALNSNQTLKSEIGTLNVELEGNHAALFILE